MERYIGVLKGMVSLMSNIDADLANKALISEHLNHIPNSKIPAEEDEDNVSNEPTAFPHPSRAKGTRICKTITHQQLQLVRGVFHSTLREYPINSMDTKLWKRYCLREDCTIGSESQTTRAINRRDDSFVWYWHEFRNREGRVYKASEKKFGQVVVFIDPPHQWEPVALIRPFNQVDSKERSCTTTAASSTGAIEAVLVSKIGGLIGRIKTEFAERNTQFLVGEWEMGR